MNRPYELAELLDKFAQQPIGPRGDRKMPDVWAQEFGVPVSSPQFLQALAAIQTKWEAAARDISRCRVSDRSKGIYQSAVSNLRQYLTFPQVMGLSQKQLAAMQPQIDILFMASETVGPQALPKPNQITLDTLKEEIAALTSEVEKADIDDAFKVLLLDALKSLLVAIASYHLLGAEGAAKLYGAAAAELARLSRSEQEDKPRGYVKRAYELTKKAGAAVIFLGAVVGGAHTAITDGSELLGITDDGTEGDKGECAPDKPKKAGDNAKPKKTS